MDANPWAPAIAALVGGLLSGPAGQAVAKLLERKSDREAWRRDRREPLYAEVKSAARRVQLALTEVTTVGQQPALLAALNDFLEAVDNLREFASKEANEQAERMSKVFLDSTFRASRGYSEDVSVFELLSEELEQFRVIMRRDLHGDDETRPWWKRLGSK